MIYKIDAPYLRSQHSLDTENLIYWSNQILTSDGTMKVTREEAADILKLARSYEYTIRKVK